jgi:hypothetical protein
MLDRQQITLEEVEQSRTRPVPGVNVTCIFDLGVPGGSNIAKDKDSMIAEAFDSAQRDARR